MTPDFKIPIVLFFFNRPLKTSRVFLKVSEQKPKRLFLVADGPRPGKADEPLILETKKIVENITWPCEVTKIYSDENLGCNKRIASGLNTVFESVDKAIVLEDDCVPHPSFFSFCEELLNRYENDEIIMHISGNVFQQSADIKEAYYFSRYPHCWGWATWRRAWEKFDGEMNVWPMAEKSKLLHTILKKKQAVNYWTSVFNQTYSEKINSWAYRWVLSCWVQNGLSISPKVNLVSNIGFGEDATHTKKEHRTLAYLEAKSLSFPLHHPQSITFNDGADALTESLIYSGGSLFQKATRKLKSLVSDRLCAKQT